VGEDLHNEMLTLPGLGNGSLCTSLVEALDVG